MMMTSDERWWWILRRSLKFRNQMTVVVLYKTKSEAGGIVHRRRTEGRLPASRIMLYDNYSIFVS